MTEVPRLALLIPAYNAARFLPRLLNSAAAQTVLFDEILVYDDCSDDDTVVIAKEMGARVIRGDTNKGCSHGKNVLTRATTAEWVHFHDADDELTPEFVSRARSWMRDGRFDVVLFAYEERDAATGERTAIRSFDPNDVGHDARSFAIRVQINPFCGLYRKEAFQDAGGYNEDPHVLYNEDVAMHLDLAFAGLKFSAEIAVTIINHRRSESMSAANRVKCLRAQYEVMRRTAARDVSRQYDTEIANRLWDIVAGLASQQDWATADAAVTLAVELGGLRTLPPGWFFRALCHVSPHQALRIRETLIRIFKSGLRKGYPGWRAPIGLIPVRHS